jgi:pentatricopeptide repeat protein
MEEAEKVFEQLLERNSIAWNALITGYAKHGLSTKALECFRKMKDASVCPDVSTYLWILRSCIALECLEIGAEIHAQVRNEGLLRGENAILGTALVDMYAKCGSLEKAQEAFDQLPVQNVMSWTSLIDGYSRNGLGEEALACFGRMRDAGLHPDKVTYLCVLKACSIVGSVETGEAIDTEVRRQGLLYNDIMLGNAVVDMYSKCVELEKAREVFEQLPERNVVSWSALMAGYSQLGKADAVLEMYIRMRTEHIVPNSVTFVISLSACCHAGLLKEGEQLFGEMYDVYCVTPTAEHYTCMVDLFGRAGCVGKVGILLNTVPHSDYPLILQSIMGPCGKWGNVKLGKWAFDELVRLNAECSSAYICMENIYAIAGMETWPVHVS